MGVILAKKVTLIIKPTKSNLSKNTQKCDSFIECEAVGLISDIRFTIQRLLHDLLPLVFLRRKKGEKKNIQFYPVFSQTMIRVTIAILDAA